MNKDKDDNDDWDDVSYDDQTSPSKSDIEQNNNFDKICNETHDQNENKLSNDIHSNHINNKELYDELKIIKVNVQILLDKIISIEEKLKISSKECDESRNSIRYNCTNALKKKLKIF